MKETKELRAGMNANREGSMRRLFFRSKGLFWKIVIRTRWRFPRARREGAAVGARAPDFTLRDLAGRSFTLSDALPDKSVLLWLTNLCESCEERIPFLEEIYEANRDRLEIFAISTLGEDRAQPMRILRRRRIDFPLLLDPEDWVGRVLGLPHPPGACPLYNLLLLDHSGIIRLRSHLSAIADAQLIDALFSLNVIR